jgi:hypothetical protein
MLKYLNLHIGLEKTGTTSIQEFLYMNQAALLRRGFWLPGCLGHKNHKLLAAFGFDVGSRDIAVTSAGVGSSSEAVDDFREKLRESLRCSVESASGKIGIITSEDLSRLARADEVSRVVRLASEIAEEVRVIAFIRRQDILATSRFYSLVRGGSAHEQVIPDIESTPKYYNFFWNIGLWIDAVGADNVLVRRFPERPEDEGFNSILEFCDIVGIDASSLDKIKAQHVSLDAVNQILMQEFNRIKVGYDPDGIEWLMGLIEPLNDRSLGQIPSEKQARQFYDRFRQGNLALLRRLKAEDQMFSEDFSMYSSESMRPKFQQLALQRLLLVLGRYR